MKKRNLMALLMMLILTLSLGMNAFAATNKKQSILDEMVSAATDLGVENSVTFKNAYDSVANYEGVITDKQYQAALDEIAYIKNEIASKGVDAVRNNEALKNELAAHVVAAAEAVGVTVVYNGNGVGFVTENTEGPIKQTGADYTATIITVIALAAAFGGCVFVAKKKRLFA